MTEYWVSKKQYWCKYCNIFIRDDAPSRRHHETGLKHQGNKERFIRDLYKVGNQAKREKAAEAQEIARIEASAAAAHARDTHVPASRPSLLSTLQTSSASSSRIRDTKPKDKWANYSSAKDLGFDDEETQKSSYEIEQEIKGRSTQVGAWEEVEDTPPQEVFYAEDDSIPGKRKLGEYQVREEEDGETFKFDHRDKRPTRDPYADDDWDPKKALGGLKFRSKEAKKFEDRKQVNAENAEGGLNREGWSGRLDLRKDGSARGSNSEGVGKVELGGRGNEAGTGGTDVKPTPVIEESTEAKPSLLQVDSEKKSDSASSSLFKKRRPPSGGRKK